MLLIVQSSRASGIEDIVEKLSYPIKTLVKVALRLINVLPIKNYTLMKIDGTMYWDINNKLICLKCATSKLRRG